MSRTQVLLFVAGGALSAGTALAQNANLDMNRAYNAELVADASTRTSLLANTGSAGYMNGAPTISDGTGNNDISFGGDFQTRYTVSVRDSSSVGSTDDLTVGFSLPLARLRTMGHIWSKDLTFK